MKKHTLCFLTASLMAATSAFAQSTVFEWGPGVDVLVGNAGAPAAFENDDTLDLGTPMFTTPGAYGNTPLSPTIYGNIIDTLEGASHPNPANIALINDHVNGGSTQDIIRYIGGGPGVNSGIDVWMLGLWTSPSDLGILDTVSFSWAKSSGQDWTSHAVIRLGTSFYVSEDLGVGGQDGDGTWEMKSATSANSWFNYDPVSSVSTVGSLASISDFSNLTGAGFLINANSTLNFRDAYVNSFATTTVPEPSVYALMIGALALGGVMWRRRMKS
jgi:hypothetical protein